MEHELADLRDVVVPLYEIRRDASWKGMGTATIIGSFDCFALFLTAKHVLEPLVDEMDSLRPVYPKLSQVVAHVGADDASFLAEVHQVSINGFTDIGLGMLVAPEGKRFGPSLAVDPSPVFPTTSIYTVGYSSLPITHRNDWDTRNFGVRLEFHLYAREGVVLCRHFGGIRNIKWPVFQVSTNIDSGMSGGPILEFRGSEPIVRGVNCRDMSLADLSAGSGEQAFASELWPILMMRPPLGEEYATEDGTVLKIETIFDMIRNGFIADRGNTVQDFIWQPNNDMVVVGWNGIPETLVAPLKTQ